MKEVWKDIKGYEGRYKISNTGKVWSIRTNKEIAKQIDRYGYNYVSLKINSEGKKFKLHRLLALAFIPNPHNKQQINHINGIKTDNRIENLEWVTQSENIKHNYRVLGVKPTWQGKHFSEEHKRKLGEIRKTIYLGGRNPKAHKIKCVETNQIFDCIKDANKWLGLKNGIYSMLSEKREQCGGYHWQVV